MMASAVFHRVLTYIEKPTPQYSGRGETALAIAVLPLAFAYKMLDCLYGKEPIPGQPWLYMLLLSAFTALAFSSVLFLATPVGERWVRRMLAENRTTWLASIPSLFVGLFLLLLWGLGLPELQTQSFSMITAPWSQLPLPLFLLLAGGVLTSCFRGGLTMSLKRSSSAPDAPSFGWRQLVCVLLATLPFLFVQEQLPLLWCFTTPVAVTVLVYGSGLGREYFGYSFVPRSAKEALFVLSLLASGLLIFLLANFLVGDITYTGGLWHTSWQRLYDSIFVYLLIVGISEEVLFRCGLLTLVAALFAKKSALGWCLQKPRLSAVLFISLLFGLVHLPRGLLFSFLALLASLLYGLAFVAGKTLFGPVLLHGLLNVLILMNFHLADF
ncbi:MAG TPA: CPBP family intramembrane glutamic endopeptidase [Negativicutes bacterium]|nr:CPBP family intramembrane glutamic endopeptidase [Negativicutes bacterium]